MATEYESKGSKTGQMVGNPSGKTNSYCKKKKNEICHEIPVIELNLFQIE